MAGLLFPEGAAFGVGSPAETAQQPSGMAGLLGGAYEALGLLAKRAFGASEMMRQTGVYNPAPMVEAAMLPMGTGAIAGVPVRGAETVLGAGPIRAYHGSPHDFDRFDLSKIGTGEGAQAYGHGLYFAEKEGIAKSYRDALAPGFKPTLNGKPFATLDDGERTVAQWISNTGAKPEEIARIARERAAKAIKEAEELGMGDLGSVLAQKHINAATAAERLVGQPVEIGRAPNGRMYEVNINADPAHFLDWDKPLAGQPQSVREAIAKLAADAPEPKSGPAKRNRAAILAGDDTVPGDVLYNNLGGYSQPGVASSRLREAGIPGIKYLDQGSRTAGEGSRNYVVFDDKLIDILRKYGLAGMAATPVMAGAMGGQNQQ